MTFYRTKEQHEKMPGFYKIFPKEGYYEGMLKRINDLQNKQTNENTINETLEFQGNWDIETLE